MSTFLSLFLALAACGPSASPAPERSERRVPAPRAPVERSTGPRAVVVVIIDQLPTHALEVYLPHLSEEGAIRRGIARGAFHRQVVYPYAGTYTAPGHAAIHTGAPPYLSGVVANEVYDYARGESVASVDDAEHAVLLTEGQFASPTVLRAETVADALGAATSGRAVIASVSMKDRAAILGGGRRPDIALWYEKDIPGFTTSAYYADSVPGWLVQWAADHPIESILATWEADDPELYERLVGPDRAPGEGNYYGLGVTFPHDPRASDRPYSVARSSPASTVYLLTLASAVAEHLDIGRDDVVDLLSISISSVDYSGHVFGPHSWEYADNLIKADRALGELLDTLERERGPIAVLITSDHGAATMPEHPRARRGGGRLSAPRVAEQLEASLDRQLGRGDWIAGFVHPFVYLTPQAREDQRRATAVAAAIRWLSARPGIEAAFDAREAVGFRESEDPLKRAVGLSVADDTVGDIFVVPAYGWVISEHGTTHGAPWDYDQTVPAIFWGPGVEHVETSEPLSLLRVATTISSLLGIPPPSSAPRDALPGVP